MSNHAADAFALSGIASTENLAAALRSRSVDVVVLAKK